MTLQILRNNTGSDVKGAQDDDFDGLIVRYARSAVEVQALLPSGGELRRCNSRSSLGSMRRTNTELSMTSRTPTRVSPKTLTFLHTTTSFFALQPCFCLRLHPLYRSRALRQLQPRLRFQSVSSCLSNPPRLTSGCLTPPLSSAWCVSPFTRFKFKMHLVFKLYVWCFSVATRNVSACSTGVTTVEDAVVSSAELAREKH